MTVFDTYSVLEKRISELHEDTRERLLYQLVGAIANERCMDVSGLHLSILNLEKSAREVSRYEN